MRGQFRDMLESMNVAMRAGSTEVRALESSRDDLKLLYSENSDIVREVDYILAAYNNGGIPLRKLFRDFADRSGLEDIESFASIYESSREKATAPARSCAKRSRLSQIRWKSRQKSKR